MQTDREGVVSPIQEKTLCMPFSRSGRTGASRRADFLRRLLPTGKSPVSFAQLWPKLQVISCWTRGASELYADKLRELFPNVEIQGKGLVATEGFVSLPLHPDKDSVLAVISHFLEFQDVANEKVLLAHELVVGNTCRVILTTGGRLYRCSLGDLIRVTGHIEDSPAGCERRNRVISRQFV
ncbi:MAG TPA: GH3 auxin-responsive promoter family protein [Candidatus Acidoferrum sp.]|nr:GH3 auxin-responsive promoter family protein [Candidatus Acidoferrum sp.]